jgi:[acyl-carrier-protein] S-malonyltransferase
MTSGEDSGGPIVLCPGQGAQAVGMGKAWFDASADAARTFGAADEILGDRLGAKLSELCFDGPEDRLNRTDVAQPALFVTGVACFQALFGDVQPSDLVAAAGLSLGEYTALHLAGSISFADGLELVTLRGSAMQAAAEASDSSMVALIGADATQAEEVCAAVLGERGGGGGRGAGGGGMDSSAVLVPANFNAPGQIVLSGDAQSCARAVEVAGEMGLRATALSVAGAFHSPIMQPAADRLAEALAKVEILPPACPVVSNVTARPHGEGPDGRPADSAELPELIRGSLIQQLTSPVRWSESCSLLVERFGGGESPAAFHELAPGKVLAGLMRRIDRKTQVVSHDRPD